MFRPGSGAAAVALAVVVTGAAPAFGAGLGVVTPRTETLDGTAAAAVSGGRP